MIKNINICILLSVVLSILGVNIGYSEDVNGNGSHLTSPQSGILENVRKLIDNHDQDIISLKSNISSYTESLKSLDELTMKPEGYTVLDEASDLIMKQKVAISECIETLNEVITVKDEIIKVAGRVEKALDSTSHLYEKKSNIDEESALLPASQFEVFQNEVRLLEASLEGKLASIREKDANFLTSQASMESERLKLESEKKQLDGELEKLLVWKSETQEEAQLIRKKRELFEDRIKSKEYRIDLLLVRKSLEWLRLQFVTIQWENTQLEMDIKAGISKRLHKKFLENEAVKKLKEVEEAKKIAEEREKIAENQKAEVVIEKEEALKKAEIAMHKQLEAVSPENKMVLAVEADMHKQEELLATIKDELITEDTERHKDVAEFKVLRETVGKFFEGDNSPEEISVELSVVDGEINRVEEKIKAIKALIAATEKQRSIIVDNLNTSRAKLFPAVSGEESHIQKEASSFTDKTLAKELIELSSLRLKHIARQASLVKFKIERLNEREELAISSLGKLTEARKELILIKASNVWERQSSRITGGTVKIAIHDLTLFKKAVISLYNDSSTGLKKLREYLNDSKNVPIFASKLAIIIAVIIGSYFGRLYLKRLSKKWQERFVKIELHSFFTYKLIPGLLYIMQGTLTMSFFLLISITISRTIPSDAPILRAAINGFAIIAVYKLIKGFVVEALSPYIGFRRWTTIAYFYVRQIYGGLRSLLTFSVVVIVLISVLNAYNYNKDVIQLLWFIYRIVSVFIVIWIFALHRAVLLNMLPYAETPFGKFINKIINIIYPFLIVLIISLSALRTLGYAKLTYTIMEAFIKAVIVTIIIYFVYRYILWLLLRAKEKRLVQEKALDEKEFAIIEKSVNLKCRIYTGLFSYGGLILTIILVFSIWNETFKDVVSSPAAPDFFKDIYNKVLVVAQLIKNSFTFKFTFADGKYTTPFKIMFGVLVLVAAFICARYLRNVIKKRIFEKAKVELGAQHAISSGVTYIIISIAALIGLNIAGIPLKSLTIFAGAFGIGVGFGMQNIINNLVSGIIILFERPIKVGDVIQVEGETKGVVEKISIRSTTIQTFDRTSVIVPNSKFLENNVINWVHGGDMVLRAIVPVGVAYGSDTELVRECLLKVAHETPNILKFPEPVVRFAEFGDSSLNFQLYVWANLDTRWMAISAINFAIDKIFREKGIVIPFPQRDVHFYPTPSKPGEHGKFDDLNNNKESSNTEASN